MVGMLQEGVEVLLGSLEEQMEQDQKKEMQHCPPPPPRSWHHNPPNLCQCARPQIWHLGHEWISATPLPEEQDCSSVTTETSSLTFLVAVLHVQGGWCHQSPYWPSSHSEYLLPSGKIQAMVYMASNVGQFGWVWEDDQWGADLEMGNGRAWQIWSKDLHHGAQYLVGAEAVWDTCLCLPHSFCSCCARVLQCWQCWRNSQGMGMYQGIPAEGYHHDNPSGCEL